MDFTDNGAAETLRWVLGPGTPTPPTALYIQLHIGDPGATGVANPAANTERQEVTFDPITSPGGSADGSAEAVTDADVEWTNVPATEVYSHISLWDDLIAGDSWYKSELPTPVQVIAGGTFRFLAGNGLLEHL